jgi:hypothetical protein
MLLLEARKARCMSSQKSRLRLALLSLEWGKSEKSSNRLALEEKNAWADTRKDDELLSYFDAQHMTHPDHPLGDLLSTKLPW